VASTPLIYVADRTTGPIFLNTDATGRLTYSIAYKLIPKRTGIASAHTIKPHSLRHCFDVVPASVELRRWRSSRLVRSRWDRGECEQVHRDEENRHEDRRAGAGRHR
jgi:hypothetical protein